MTVLAYLDTALLLSLLLTSIVRHIKVICHLHVVAIVVGSLLPFVLFDGLQLYGYVHAALGELSMVTRSVLVLVLLDRGWGRQLIDRRQFSSLHYGIALVGLGFYPLALGVSMIDPYAWGFSPLWLTVAVIAVALVCSVLRYYAISIILLLALFVYYAGVPESDNLWDVLIDPVIWLYALVFSCATLWRRLSRAQPTPQP